MPIVKLYSGNGEYEYLGSIIELLLLLTLYSDAITANNGHVALQWNNKNMFFIFNNTFSVNVFFSSYFCHTWQKVKLTLCRWSSLAVVLGPKPVNVSKYYCLIHGFVVYSKQGVKERLP